MMWYTFLKSKGGFPLVEYIKQQAARLGANLCGIANVDRFADAPAGFHPTDIYADCQSVVVIARAMPKGLTKVSPRLIYGHGNELAKERVDICVQDLAMAMETQGCIAVPLPSDDPYDVWDVETTTGKGILSMKHAAVLAGLGFLGKSTILINDRYGTLLTLGAILTNVSLTSDELAVSHCIHSCSRCISACPSGALDGVTVNQTKCRKHTYGTNARGFPVVNCNTCRTVCPLAYGASNR